MTDIARRPGAAPPPRDTVHFKLLYFRDLVIELIGRDLKLRYKRSVLGIGWSLLKPLSQLVIFAFLFNKIIPLDIPNYTAFLFIGVLVWSWFGSAISGSTNAVTGSPELIRRPGFPLLALPTVTVASSAIHFVLALPLLLVFTIYQADFPGRALLALPLLIVLQFLLALGIGSFIAALQVKFRDTEHIVGVLLMLGFYVTPVFYRPDGVPDAIRWIYDLNPMAALITAYRDVLLHHQWPTMTSLGVITLAGAVSLIVGIATFNYLSATFVEEV